MDNAKRIHPLKASPIAKNNYHVFGNDLKIELPLAHLIE
jgi:hypothetical protein